MQSEGKILDGSLQTKYDVCVVGLGYIGLPTATVLANSGVAVLGVDISPTVVETINDGRIHIVEPGLEAAVSTAVQNKRLTASLAPHFASCYVIAVPTPLRDDKTANLDYVLAAARTVAPLLEHETLVILESTSPPGTTRKISELVRAERPDLVDESGKQTVLFAHAPERVLPGRAMREIIENDRVIGGLTPEASDRAADLYRKFVTGGILLTDATTAELVKLAENSFRDVNIAFANELSEIADEVSVNVWDVVRLANRHPRVNIMQPGPGVGGHCIAVDPWFIVDAAPAVSKLIRTARTINDGRPERVVRDVLSKVGRLPTGGKVAILGLAFKPNIDDLRASPALAIADTLLRIAPGTEFLISEPNIHEMPAALERYSNAIMVDDVRVAIGESDLVVLLVDHSEYRQLPNPKLQGKTIVDTRGVWSTIDIREVI